MSQRLLQLMSVGATIAVMSLIMATVGGQAQTTTGKAAALKTPWGEPDLQGIWSVERHVPLQRPAGVTREFYTEGEVAALDALRSGKSVFGNAVRSKRGSEDDVAGAYDAVFTSQRPTGRRTSMITDPPDGKIPPLTPQAQERQAAFREYQRALVQATNVCKNTLPGCVYGPPSPRRSEPPPEFPSAGVGPINRSDGPEDRGLSERCLGGSLPDLFAGFTGVHRRIVQSPGVVTIYYDTGQGQGYMRVIPVTDRPRPHLPSQFRQWWGDSLGHWERDTLVVDVTNFSFKTNFLESRENLHLVERWKRSGPLTVEAVSTMEDPTTWTRPWTVIQEFDLQDNFRNRLYTEPRCHEGNLGLLGLLVGERAVEKAFEAGLGPDPATLCTGSCAEPSAENRDPIALQ